jgi:hypothetical protein
MESAARSVFRNLSHFEEHFITFYSGAIHHLLSSPAS